MPIRIKRGVTPQHLLLFAAAVNAHDQVLGEGVPGVPLDLVVTSGSDGRHKAGSAHYASAALDLRSKPFRTLEAKLAFLQAWMGRLGPVVEVTTPQGPGYMTRDGRWLAILEYVGKGNEHFHGEEN